MTLVVRKIGGGFDRLSLDAPAPTVMADGIAGVCRRGWQYWIEGPTLIPPGVIPKEGGEVCDPDPREIERQMRIWVERQVGLRNGTPGARNFPGTAHEFIDCTDLPSPSIVAGRPVNIVIEDNGPEPLMSDNSKPPYRVPLMSEIAALPWNGFNVVSTFAGCGGSSTGYRMAGFKVLLASEFVEAARDTYAANARPGTIIDGRDIRDVQAADILDRIGLAPGELDVLDGSPPCASFSTAGKREKAWGTVKKYSDTEQRADDLFFEYARLVDGIRPKVFVAENVSGLVKGTAKGYFLEILAALKAAGPGYRVAVRLLDAQWLGVPQARQRVIFVGVRSDLGLDPVHPKPLPYRYSIRDALPWLTRVVHDTSGQFGAGVVTDRPSPAITVGVNSINSLHFKVEGPADQIVAVGASAGFGEEAWQSPDLPAKTIGASPSTGNGKVGSGDVLVIRPETRRIQPTDTVPDHVGASLEGYAIGAEWDKLAPGGQSEKYFQLVRPDPDGPSPTITASGGGGGGVGVAGSTAGVTHPTEKRKFSIAELRRIGGFPDDFVLTGTYAQQWERIGRAVPPVMMSHVAAAVRDGILGKL